MVAGTARSMGITTRDALLIKRKTWKSDKKKRNASKIDNKLYSLKDASALIKVLASQNLMSLLISQCVWV
jgi:hypothetical protein